MTNVKEKLNEKVQELINMPEYVDGHGDLLEILIGLLFEDNHVHLHTPIDNDSLKAIVEALFRERNIKLASQEQQKAIPTPDSTINIKSLKMEKLEREEGKERKIIFAHNRAAGDALMFSAGIRDFKLLFPDIKINVASNQSWLWENNPYIDRSLNKNDPDVEFYKVGYPAVGYVNNSSIHFTNMFLLDMIAVADLHENLPISLGESNDSTKSKDLLPLASWTQWKRDP